MNTTNKPFMLSKEFYRRTCKILDNVLPNIDDVLWAKIYRLCQGLIDVEWFKNVVVDGFRKDVVRADKIITSLKEFCQGPPKDVVFEKKCDDMIASLIEKTENQRALINSSLVKGKGGKKKFIQGIVIAMMVETLSLTVEKKYIAFNKVAIISSKLCGKIAPKTVKNIYLKYHKVAGAL